MPSVTSNGCEIHFDVIGRGDPVLLLHGLGSCFEDWEPQIKALAPRFTVIGVDFRGHGRSGKPRGPYSIPMFAADVGRVLYTLRVDFAHVVGLSLGGMVAFQLAVDSPALVRSLAVVNSAPGVVPRTFREHSMVTARRAGLALLGLPGLAARIAKANLPRDDQAELRAKLEARIAGNDFAAYRATTDAIIGWTVEDRIGEIACPVLVVAGDRDYTPVEAKRAYAAKMRRARVAVVAESSHVTPIDRPDAFNRLLVDFLCEQQPSAPRVLADPAFVR
jgi:pimeloyl-ACP methyl ester carboxylesterase